MTNESILENVSISNLYLYYLNFFKLILNNKFFLFCFFLIGSISGFFISKSIPKSYKAEYKFVIKENKSNSLNIAFAASLGFDLDPVVESDIYKSSTFPDLFLSRGIIEKSLLKTTRIKNEEISFADLYRKLFFKNNGSKKFVKIFISRLDKHQFSKYKDSILNVIYKDIIDHKLNIYRDKKNRDVFVAELTSNNEFFSLKFLKTLFDVVMEDYILMKSNGIILLENRIKELSTKTDELMNLNGSKSSSFPIANQWDKTFNKYDIQIELNMRILNQLTEQMEIAKLNLKNKSEFIQFIEFTEGHIFVENKINYGWIFISGFLSILIGYLFLIIKIKFKSQKNYFV